MITFQVFLGRCGGVGMPDMPHSFGCIATEAFVPPVKDFTLGVSVVILDGASIVQMLKGV